MLSRKVDSAFRAAADGQAGNHPPGLVPEREGTIPPATSDASARARSKGWYRGADAVASRTAGQCLVSPTCCATADWAASSDPLWRMMPSRLPTAGGAVISVECAASQRCQHGRASAVALQHALIRRMPTRNLLDVLTKIEH